MPAKDKDPTSPTSPAKPRAKAKPKAETPATPAAPKKAAAGSRAKRPVTEPIAAAAAAPTPDAVAAPKRRRAPKPVAAAVAEPSALVADVSAPSEPVSAASIETVSAGRSEIPGDAALSREAQIRLRAYLIYAERGYRPGSPESDWFQAEQEVAYGRRA